jgi:transcriptional antiterminator RfaH
MGWYLIHSKPRQEARALENLQRQGYEAWLPMLTVEKIRRGRIVQVTEPMFSRYLFIQLDAVLSNWAPIRSTLGVSRLVTFGAVPASVPDELIEALRDTSAQEPQRLLAPGEEVLFVDGPLQGLRGIFQQHDGETRAMVLIELLSKPQAIAVNSGDLRPVG